MMLKAIQMEMIKKIAEIPNFLIFTTKNRNNAVQPLTEHFHTKFHVLNFNYMGSSGIHFGFHIK